jgi:hypothetical protein
MEVKQSVEMEENQISPMSDSSVSSPKTILEDVSGVDPKTLFPVIRLSFQVSCEIKILFECIYFFN